MSPDTPDEQRFYRSFDLPDYFIHDYYGEVLNKIEQENKKKQKFCAKMINGLRIPNAFLQTES